MAITKRFNRQIVVESETYIWHLKGNYAWEGPRHIAVRHADWPQGQLLLLDQNAFAFEVRPRTIRECIEFALLNDWHPEDKALPLYVGFDNVQYVLLSAEEQYTRVYQPS